MWTNGYFFIDWLRAFPALSLHFVPVEHICWTTEGNVKCSGYPVVMKKKKSRLNEREQSECRRGAHVQCLLVDIWHSGDEAESRLATNEKLLQTVCECVCDVVFRAGGSYWVQVHCKRLRWVWGYKMWTGKIKGFDGNQGHLWLWCMCVFTHAWLSVFLSVCLWLTCLRAVRFFIIKESRNSSPKRGSHSERDVDGVSQITHFI